MLSVELLACRPAKLGRISIFRVVLLYCTETAPLTPGSTASALQLCKLQHLLASQIDGTHANAHTKMQRAHTHRHTHRYTNKHS